MTANYHTHTRWCNHGSGEIEDYIKAAIKAGYKQLAFTEHVPLPGDPDADRMLCREFPAYNAELETMIEKYAGRISILKGWECEYYPEMLEEYRRYQEDFGYKFLILGHHRSKDRKIFNFTITEPWQVARYAEDACEALHTGLFSYFAHPDVFMYAYPQADGTVEEAMGRIFAACAALGIPAEINANGRRGGRGYPCPQIWRDIAPRYKGLRCMVGADAHHVRDLTGKPIADCERLALEAGLDLRYTLEDTKARTA